MHSAGYDQMNFWTDAFFGALKYSKNATMQVAATTADEALAEFLKRFPPAAEEEGE